jgi:peptidoglycan L-alanyl-D-glutamate endopeptidase CwlK
MPGPHQAGPKVTWTLTSNHFVKSDGFGHAVDLVPYPVDWTDLKKFDAIGRAMFAAADELGIKIRWGADWDRDGKPRERGESDSPHFELAR